ncbi:MAG: GNAT family N-acetyltransferase [Planctomycetota bacterium]
MTPLTDVDGEALRELWNGSSPHDTLTARLFDEKVWRDQRPGVRLAEFVDGRPVGFVTSVYEESTDPPRGYVKLLAVAPEHRGGGIGCRLLEAAERAAWAAGAGEVRLCESAPNYLTPGVDARGAEAIAFFERRGYRRLGEAVNQSAPLSYLPDADPSDGFVIRRATPLDTDAERKLLDANWPSWNAEVAIALAADPPTLFIATGLNGESGRVIGFAVYESNNLGTGWFGPMGADPAARGRGVGRLLLLHTLAAMRDDGFPRAIIPWVGPVEFYERTIGAKIDRRFVRLAKTRPSDTRPSDRNQ